MVCNTGVSLTPLIDGKLYHFEARGLFNGLSLIQDMETMSVWDHYTGVAVHGPLEGKRMEVGNLLQMNIIQALGAYPDIHVAISDVEMRSNRWSPDNEDVPGLMPLFTNTIEAEDDRLATMDMGIGVWTEKTARYYSLSGELGETGLLFDVIDGRRIVIFNDPTSSTPVAYYVEADTGSMRDGALVLEDGTTFRDGIAYDGDGQRQGLPRPLQQFTRWYGFSLSFPDCEVHGQATGE